MAKPSEEPDMADVTVKYFKTDRIVGAYKGRPAKGKDGGAPMKDRRARPVHPATVAAPPGIRQQWAVLVGINDYAEFEDLDFCKNDAVALAAKLVEMGFPKENVSVLTDGASDAKDLPTRANIQTRIRNVLRVADEGDLVLVSFNGHGISAGGKTYLCPTGARRADPNDTMIPLLDVYASLSGSKASYKLLWVDACREDVLPGGRRSARASAELRDGFVAAALRDAPRGIATLCSCAEDQFSWEDPSLGHGVFTHYLLEGLSGIADAEERGNRDNRVSIMELYNYASIKTRRWVLSEKDGVQTPELMLRATGDFDIIAILPQEITNSIGMKLRLIPACEFVMGSGKSPQEVVRLLDLHEGDAGYLTDEHPRHRVRITRPFYLGVMEVTQGQWQAVMETHPWSGNSYVKEGADYAANYVSWEDAQVFCDRLSEREGATYRLPTEAEWECACRAGTTTMYHFGDDTSRLCEYAWFDETANDVYERYAHRVGLKKPNPFGLHDMHGNVLEWCHDRHDWHYYANSPTNDPPGPSEGSRRVYRGGGWTSGARSCRSAERNHHWPVLRDCYAGFRVAHSPSDE